MISNNLFFYGRSQPLPEQIPLRAGPLSAIYQAGDLRYIRLGNIEILRRVYSAMRDHNWDTILPQISNEEVEVGKDSFRISYDVSNQKDEIDFFWRGTIIGEMDGTIIFSMVGEARSTFLRNRLGFCVLHPMSCAGIRAKIEHVDGSLEECHFPKWIAPQFIKNSHPWPAAPFDNMRALSHQVIGNLWAEVRFSGDIFEMEDQRNWTDASFKTYCTPLSLPKPVQVEKGSTITQSIQLRLIGKPPPAQIGEETEYVKIRVKENESKALPPLGLSIADHGRSLSNTEINCLKRLQLDHLRVDVTPSEPDYQDRLQQAAQEANAIGTQIAIALFLSEDAENELTDLIKLLPRLNTAVSHYLIFHKTESVTPAGLIKLTREMLRQWDETAVLAGGTNVYFTTINANQPPIEEIDAIAYSINPQVHAFDNLSLTETLAAQAETVLSTRHFAQGKPIFVGPITLKPRFNPNAAAPEEPRPHELPTAVDERQSSLYGAGWTLGSLKYLAEVGTDKLTYFETTGWRGVMAEESGSLLPDQFWSVPGGVYPLYHLLADVAEFANGRVYLTYSNQPLVIESLRLQKEEKQALLLANFTPDSQKIHLADLPATVQTRSLNETNVVEALQDPELFRQRPYQLLELVNGRLDLRLLPFEYLRIDF